MVAIALVKTLSVKCINTLSLWYEKVNISLNPLSLCVSQFAVHLGIARGSSVIMLEQTGKNSGYIDKDVCGFCPENHCCVEGGPEKLDSVIKMRAVSKEFKQAGVDVLYSRDAGR